MADQSPLNSTLFSYDNSTHLLATETLRDDFVGSIEISVMAVFTNTSGLYVYEPDVNLTERATVTFVFKPCSASIETPSINFDQQVYKIKPASPPAQFFSIDSFSHSSICTLSGFLFLSLANAPKDDALPPALNESLTFLKSNMTFIL